MICSRLVVSPILIGGLLLAGCSMIDRGPIEPASTDALERVSEKGPVKLVVRLSPRTPRLSDLVELEVEVTAQPDIDIKPPVFGQAVGDFLVRDYTEKSDERTKLESQKTQKIVKRFQYRLEPVHAGQHLIRSVAIEFVDNRAGSESRGKPSTIESEPIEVEVTSELGGKVPSLSDLKPMLAPRPLSTASSWNWLWLALPGILIVGLIAWFYRRRKSQADEPITLSPTEVAQAALAALLSENLPAQSRFQEFYLRLTGIVRYYIEGTTGVRAPEQTTEEFMRAMRSGNLFRAEQAVRLKEFLEAADMVKYAGQQPNSDQIELSIGRAREFVEMRSPLLVPSIASEAS